ncbi:MAG: OB-fold domain-containing protein [Syntrophales bacterium]|jgi:hypothetical protein
MIGAIHPTEDFESRPYWDWLRKEDFRLQKCGGCGKFRFPAYPSCPYCGQRGGDWVPLSGRGEIYSWFVANVTPEPRYKEDVPYIIATIQLEEGPRIVSQLVGCFPEEVKADMPVQGKYHRVDDKLVLYVFNPV